MPGPRNKTKTKARTSNPATPNLNGSGSSLSVVRQDALADDIVSVEGWRDIVDYLCDSFNLPPLNRRSGLKKIHAKFSEIYKKMNDAYMRNSENPKIVGGIVSIWAKMCVDAVLRNRLVREGLITKISPLLDMRPTRVIGLEALATVTHHGGLEVRSEIAKQTPTLLRLMEEFPDNTRINELAITSISHSVGSVINEEHIDRPLVNSLDVQNVFRHVLNAMRRPNASFQLIEHGITLFTSGTRHCHQDIKSLPPLLTLLAACLRVNDISVRCNALASFIRINLPGSEEENRFFDPRRLIEGVQRRFPDHLVDKMMDFGAGQCETTLLVQTTADYQKAMMKCAQDKNLYALGKTLAELIVRTEFSVSEVFNL